MSVYSTLFSNTPRHLCFGIWVSILTCPHSNKFCVFSCFSMNSIPRVWQKESLRSDTDWCLSRHLRRSEFHHSSQKKPGRINPERDTFLCINPCVGDQGRVVFSHSHWKQVGILNRFLLCEGILDFISEALNDHSYWCGKIPTISFFPSETMH